jgi:hypothetical protein
MPVTAHACAMPLPIVPAPITPTVLIVLMVSRPCLFVSNRDYAARGSSG